MRGVKEVKSYMEENSINGEIIMFKAEQAKTSASAAEHLGCEVAQIAKSIVLKAENPILVILSGDMRVDLKKLSEVFGEKAKLASPEYVSEEVGFIIGGVPPMGFDRPVRILIDKSIERFSTKSQKPLALNSTPHRTYMLPPSIANMWAVSS